MYRAIVVRSIGDRQAGLTFYIYIYKSRLSRGKTDTALNRYRGTAKLKVCGCRTPSAEAPVVAAYGTSYRLVRSDAQLAGHAVALLSNG